MRQSAPSADLRTAPIAALLWPVAADSRLAALRALVLVLAGCGLLALSAKVQVPMYPVPMTMQSLVVVMIGAVYGWRLGAATLIAYLAQGLAGLPVFAGAVAGPAYMAGPTGGFLLGFVAGAFATGWMVENGFGRSTARLFVAMAVGHAVLFALGFAWLAYGLNLGPARAFAVGVAPFIVGSVVKTLLGALLVPQLNRLAARRG